jgi:hypothetical protein
VVDTIDIGQQAALSICESLALILCGEKCVECAIWWVEKGQETDLSSQERSNETMAALSKEKSSRDENGAGGANECGFVFVSDVGERLKSR